MRLAARHGRTARVACGAARVVPVSAALAIGAAAHADPCAVRAELAGDATLIRKVGDELARLGVERGQPAPGCRGVFAQLEPDREGIAVAIRDGSRRTEGRVVSDAAIAASWIDSWLHDDLDGNAWLLAAPVRVAQTPAATPVTPAAEPRDREPTRSVLDRFAAVAAYEYAWPDDEATASGVSGAGCVMIGGVCLGGAIRYVREADRVVELTAMARSDLSMMATARLPVRAGKMSIAPEVGVGVARMFTRRIDGCENVMDPNTPPGCDPTDPMCVPPPSCMDASGKVYVGDDFRATTWTPRLAAGVRVGVPIADRVWLDGVASFVVSPLAHTDPFVASGMVSPDGTVQPSGVDLPGEPGHGFQLGIGIRVGAP